MKRALRPLLAAMLAAVPAWAHGGEDHGEAPPPPTATADTRTATATTTALELVVRWPAQPASAGPLRLRLLASEYATNAPVEAARIELTFSSTGKPDTTATVPATKSPGVYQAELALPGDGHYALSATVIAGELVDVVAIADLEIGAPPSVAQAGQQPFSTRRWMGAVAVTLAACSVVLLWRWRRRRARAAASVAVALLAVLVGGRPTLAAPPGKGGRVFLAKESQFLLGVRTAVVEARTLADRIIVPGVVTAPPERHASIFMPQSGRVAPPRGGFPQLGARISRGQLLGVVEAVLSAAERASFLAEEARARADAASGAARLDAAEKVKARLESLIGVASRQQLEAAEVDVLSARAAIVDAEARRAAFSTSAGVSRFELVSPLDGVLADISVSPGEVLSAGERAFLVIDPSELTVEAKVPEHELARLVGSADALVSVDAFPGKSFAGKVRAQGQVIDPDTRTAKVVFTVDNSAGLLMLGMFARVQIGTGGAGSFVAVADAAVLDVDGRRVVYLHTAPEEFEAREIAVGRRDGDLLEVLEGLDAGDRVVVIGAYSLRNAPAR